MGEPVAPGSPFCLGDVVLVTRHNNSHIAGKVGTVVGEKYGYVLVRLRNLPNMKVVDDSVPIHARHLCIASAIDALAEIVKPPLPGPCIG